MAPALGSALTELRPHGPESPLSFSFKLTRLRTPAAGTSGTFVVRTTTAAGLVIDAGVVAGAQVGAGGSLLI